MKAGRPPKPVELKKLEGTYRKDRDKGVLSMPKVVEVPEPPEQITDNAQILFQDICDILITAGILEVIDVHTVALLAEEMATYYEMTEKLKKTGRTYLSPHGHLVKRPETVIRNESLANSLRLMAQLGLTPAMRQKFGFMQSQTQTKIEEAKKISIR